MTFSSLEYVVSDGVAHIRLGRPQRHNALDLVLARELAAAVERSQVDEDVRVVLLSGDGPSFCVGGDVVSMASASDPGGHVRHLATAAHRAIRLLHETDKPVVVAAHGNIAGAGLGLCCSADLVVAGRSARFVSAFTAVGLSPDSGTSWLLPRVVGLQRALELTLLNSTLSAETAKEWGLVTRLAYDEDVLTDGWELARTLADGPSRASGRTRLLVRGAWDGDLAGQLDRELQSIADLADTDEAVERMAGFVNRQA